jgi:hypothetical protein
LPFEITQQRRDVIEELRARQRLTGGEQRIAPNRHPPRFQYSRTPGAQIPGERREFIILFSHIRPSSIPGP